MSQVRIWNITDDPANDHSPRGLMVFGRSVPPGRYVLVDTARLEGAHKLNKDVDNGLVYVGSRPSYVAARQMPRLTLPEGVNRAHHSVSAPSEPTHVALYGSDKPVVLDSSSTSVEDVSIEPPAPKRRRRKSS